MSNPFDVVRQFEREVAQYTEAPFCVAVTSCTAAIMLAVAWRLRDMERQASMISAVAGGSWRPMIEIPKRTYVGVGHSILNAGGKVAFREESWLGMYDLRPLHIFDSARWFTSGLWNIPPQGVGRPATPSTGYMICTSHHAQKTLGDTQAGCILHDDPEADVWLRRARFDGRAEGVAPKNDKFDQRAWHCYLSPDVASRLLWKLSFLSRLNAPLPPDDYPPLDEMEIFQ